MSALPHRRNVDELYEAQIAALNEKLAAKDRVIGDIVRVLEDKDRVIENKDRVIENKDRLIEDKDRVIGDKDRVLEDKDRVIGDIVRVLEDKDRVIINTSIFRYLEEGGALPALRQCGTDSGASVASSKVAARIIQADFGLVDIDEALVERSKNTTSTVFRTNSKPVNAYASESDVTFHINCVIHDVISASGLSNQLQFNSQLKISELIPDHWVINCNGFPVGAIEIKKPDDMSGIKEQRIYGQLYDYMAIIQSFCGTNHVLGIFTNYNQWVICWFPESNVCASATNLDYECVHVPPLDTSNRELCISTTYTRSNSRQLFIALYTVFKKMAKNSMFVQPQLFLSNTRNYIAMPPNELWSWKSIDLPKWLSLQSFTANQPTLYLLCDFGAGSDGRVWLVCDDEAHLAVIKFLRNEISDDAAEKEVDLWHRLGFQQVYYGYYSSVVSIVLPYAFTYCKDPYDKIVIDYSRWEVPIVPNIAQAEVNGPVVNSDGGDSNVTPRNLELIIGCDSLIEQLNAKDPVAVLRECIQKCIDNQLVHDDIKWRHVGLFPVPREDVDGYKLIANFIDLTGMRQVRSKAKAEKRMKAKFENLTNEPWKV